MQILFIHISNTWFLNKDFEGNILNKTELICLHSQMISSFIMFSLVWFGFMAYQPL